MKQAPDFKLKDQTGTERTLGEFRGKWVILYFYPKDDTPGCTTEACGFRDSHEALLANDAVVIGVSKDTVESHQKFIAKYNLPFTLLSNPELDVIQAYGAWGKGFMGRIGTLRQTFIINPEGQIVKEYPKVTPAEHATAIIEDLKALKA